MQSIVISLKVILYIKVPRHWPLCGKFAFVWEIHRWPVNTPHKGPETRKMVPFDDVIMVTLQWRHNGRDRVSNYKPQDCLLNRLFRRRSKKTSKLRVTGLCAGNSPGTGEFSAQMTHSAENVSIWWRHHDVHHPLFWKTKNFYPTCSIALLLIPCYWLVPSEYCYLTTRRVNMCILVLRRYPVGNLISCFLYATWFLMTYSSFDE